MDCGKYTWDNCRRDFGEWLFKNVRNDCKSKYEEVWEGTNTNVKDLFDLAALAAYKGATAGSRPEGFTIEKARCILKATGFFELADKGAEWLPDPDPQVFDGQHHTWCKKVSKKAKSLGIEDWMYGRSAKLINVFLKAVMLCKHKTPPDGEEKAKWYAVHPPIDRIVLQGMNHKDNEKNGEVRFGCEYPKWITLPGTDKKPSGIPTWSKFKYKHYRAVIKMIRDDLGGCPLWKNERFFKP